MIFNFNRGETTDFTKATATATDVATGKTFYAGDNRLKTGTLITDGAPLNTKVLTTTDVRFDWYNTSTKAKLYDVNGKYYWIYRAATTSDDTNNILRFYMSAYFNVTSSYFYINFYSGTTQTSRLTSNTYFNKIEFYA